MSVSPCASRSDDSAAYLDLLQHGPITDAYEQLPIGHIFAHQPVAIVVSHFDSVVRHGDDTMIGRANPAKKSSIEATSFALVLAKLVSRVNRSSRKTIPASSSTKFMNSWLPTLHESSSWGRKLPSLATAR